MVFLTRPPAPDARTLASPLFHDGVFRNPAAGAEDAKGFLDVLKWRLTAKRAAWPDFVDDNATPRVPPRVHEGIRVTMVNHATLLIQAGGLNILTDPVWSKRVSPFSLVGPARHRAPGIAFDDLPQIDAVVISHAHYDHLDRKTVQRLEDKFHPQYFVPLRNRDLLPDAGARIHDMDWNDQAYLGDALSVTLLPANHWSARGLKDRNMRLWGAYMLTVQDGDGSRNIYFGGDSGYGPHYKAAREKFGQIDVALLPIGAYEPRWFMRAQHMNPDDAVQAHLDLHAKHSIGIHFGTFQLTDEAIDAPVQDLLSAMARHHIAADDFIAPKNGQTLAFK